MLLAGTLVVLETHIEEVGDAVVVIVAAFVDVGSAGERQRKPFDSAVESLEVRHFHIGSCSRRRGENSKNEEEEQNTRRGCPGCSHALDPLEDWGVFAAIIPAACPYVNEKGRRIAPPAP